jgi:hypothetical protein
MTGRSLKLSAIFGKSRVKVEAIVRDLRRPIYILLRPEVRPGSFGQARRPVVINRGSCNVFPGRRTKVAIAPTTGPVGGLVSDAAQPRPATAPVPDQPEAQSTQAETPSQSVTPTSTDTGVDQEAPRDRNVDITV